MNKITTKARMYEAMAASQFGNTTQSWFTVADFLAAGPHDGLFGIRSLTAGSRCDYNVPAEEVVDRCAGWPGHFNVSPMQPDWAIAIQGEVCRDLQLRLYYSTHKKPMRRALAEGGRQVDGLTAKLTLEHYLDPSSYEDIMVLLDRYPDHVVEFSTYRVGVGHDKRRKTVIWEVRLY